MKKIRVKEKSAQKIRKGYPLVHKEDLLESMENWPKEWVTFTDKQNNPLAVGYLGKQNKGVGWILLNNPNEEINLEFFDQKFTNAKNNRKKLFKDSKTTAFRLFNGEGDGIGGLTIDWYNHYLVISWYNDTLYQQRGMIYQGISQAIPEAIGMYEKIRFQQEGIKESSHIAGEVIPEGFTISENDIRYVVSLDEGLMTGIFLDQREVRQRLSEELSKDQTVLNTFSYTGAFSVAAAIGGASQTVSVDLARRSLVKTKEQFEVNGLNLSNHQIKVMDVFEYVKYGNRKKLEFDLVILDPPSFARNKKKSFSTIKNYGDLVYETAPLVKSNGLLIASCNTANLTMEKFQNTIKQALDDLDYCYTIEEVRQLPFDFAVDKKFPEGNYLKVLFIRIKRKSRLK